MDTIDTVAIIGGGTMGRRIAYGCAIKGVAVRLFDSAPAALDAAVPAIRRIIEERVAAGRLPAGTTEAALPLIAVCRSLKAAVTGVDLAIETVFESVEAKRAVFAEIDRFAAPEVLIGTNTSSIPGSWLADATKRPEKVFNFNWSTPDLPKVEIMGHPGTAPATLEAANRFVRALGLVPINVRGELIGYATNRIWRAVKKEVLWQLDRGYITPEDLDRSWMLDWGSSMGPCGLMDAVGLDTIRAVEMIYYNASKEPSDKPPKLLDDMIAAGTLGVKTGRGFYRYPNPAYAAPGFLTGEPAEG
jgi:3-hydroxybutyryl-CoA dehydrogenase